MGSSQDSSQVLFVCMITNVRFVALSYPDRSAMRPSRRNRHACHPTDKELDDSLGSATVAVRIGTGAHSLVSSWVVKERTYGCDNRLWICTREAGSAGSNRFR